MNAQMIRVISSPSSSTIGFLTLIFASGIGARDASGAGHRLPANPPEEVPVPSVRLHRCPFTFVDNNLAETINAGRLFEQAGATAATPSA